MLFQERQIMQRESLPGEMLIEQIIEYQLRGSGLHDHTFCTITPRTVFFCKTKISLGNSSSNL